MGTSQTSINIRGAWLRLHADGFNYSYETVRTWFHELFPNCSEVSVLPGTGSNGGSQYDQLKKRAQLAQISDGYTGSDRAAISAVFAAIGHLPEPIMGRDLYLLVELHGAGSESTLRRRNVYANRELSRVEAKAAVGGKTLPEQTPTRKTRKKSRADYGRTVDTQAVPA